MKEVVMGQCTSGQMFVGQLDTATGNVEEALSLQMMPGQGNSMSVGMVGFNMFFNPEERITIKEQHVLFIAKAIPLEIRNQYVTAVTGLITEVNQATVNKLSGSGGLKVVK